MNGYLAVVEKNLLCASVILSGVEGYAGDSCNMVSRITAGLTMTQQLKSFRKHSQPFNN